MLTIPQHHSLVDGVVGYLREELLDSEAYPKGEYLREEELAQKLNTSRGPIREALKILEGEGLVKILPRRGAIVVDFSAEEVDELWNVRYALENMVYTRIIEHDLFTDKSCKSLMRILDTVAELIAEKNAAMPYKISVCNLEFHLEIARISQMTCTVRFLYQVYSQMRQALMRELRVPGRIDGFVERHVGILNHLCQKDLESLMQDGSHSYFTERKKNCELSGQTPMDPAIGKLVMGDIGT
jgi:DNA-binding GntR family transcriptional regulator